MTTKAPDRNPLVIALGGALLGSLLIIAFLLGRATAEKTAPSPTTPTATSAPFRETDPGRPISLPTAESALVPVSTPTRASGEAGEPALARLASPLPTNFDAHTAFPPSGASPAPSPAADQQAVHAYFARIDEIDEVGAGDPQAFATSMLQSVASGDFSGFDDLLSRARRQQERLRNITPPRCCVDHHLLALTLSLDSVRILEDIRGALARGDSAALMSIAAEGGDLQARANQLKAMGERIKGQVGS